MKLSNEVKIGAIALLAIVLLVFGFSYLKGKKFFSADTNLVAVYNNIQGLQPSNPVTINGMEVGNVYKIIPDKYMRAIAVELNIDKKISIPINSIAIIQSNPLGSTGIEIKLGDASSFLKSKDTILTETSAGMFSEVLKKVDPVLYEVRKAVSTIDTLAGNFNNTLDPATKGNLQQSIANLNNMTASMAITSANLQRLIAAQQHAIGATIGNLNSITGNLADQKGKINNIMTNFETTSRNFSDLQVQQTMQKLDDVANDLKTLTAKLNDSKGSLGMLLNDPRLYNNLASTGNKLNLLVDDIRMNPKRYITISVFGKKQSGQPIMVPLPDTINAPYYVEKVEVKQP